VIAQHSRGSGVQSDFGLLVTRLLGTKRAAAKDLVTKADCSQAVALLQDALKAPLIHDKLKSEITSRLAEVKAVR
jgi:hypothetical protein